MRKSRKYRYFTALQVLIFAFLLLTHYTGPARLAVAGALPLLVLPMLCAFSMFHDEMVSAFTGLTIGILMDSVAARSVCFNAIMMFLISLAVSLITRLLFNNNIRAALALGIIGSLFYFLVRWAVFFAFYETAAGNMTYLTRFALPSAIYTAAFLVPFYYLQRLLYRKTAELQQR